MKSCSKIKYGSLSIAKTALKRTNKLNGQLPDFGDCYLCHECNCFHITSIASTEKKTAEIIKKQDEMISLLTTENNLLYKNNATLNEKLLEVNKLNDGAAERTLDYIKTIEQENKILKEKYLSSEDEFKSKLIKITEHYIGLLNKRESQLNLSLNSFGTTTAGTGII